MSRERERFDEIGKKIKRESDAPLQGIGGGSGGRRYSNNIHQLSGTLNTVTPCAACKLLRRRCAQECPFSPYFSPHEPLKFASVHKVFGASNVSKMLMEVPESQRADAANSLVYEANVRLRDPVYGCMGAISALQQQIQILQAELNAVRAEILKYKFREANTTTNNNIVAPIANNNTHHVTTFLNSSGAVSVAVPPPPLTPPTAPSPAPLQTPPQQPLPPPAHNSLRDDQQPSNLSLISSSMFTQPSSSTTHDHYDSISHENISYFG